MLFRSSGVTGITIGGKAVTSFTVVSGTSITAVVSNGSTGTIVVTEVAGTGTSASSFTYTTPSPPGNALNFDGTDDYVTTPVGASFSFGTGDFTIEAWVKLTGSGTYIAAGRYNSTGDDYWLGPDDGPRLDGSIESFFTRS